LWIIIGSVIGGLIVLGILVISIPFDLTWKLEVYDRLKITLTWAWLWGLLRRDVQMKKRPPKKRRARMGFRKAIRNFQTVLDLLSTRGLLAHLVRFLTRAFRNLRFRNLKLDLLVGLGDPAETFYLIAVTEPLNRLVASVQPYPVNIRLSYSEAVFEGLFQGEVRVYPVRLIPSTVQFIFSAPVFRLLRKVISMRWRRNK
jgi:hypothetical protein